MSSTAYVLDTEYSKDGGGAAIIKTFYKGIFRVDARLRYANSMDHTPGLQISVWKYTPSVWSYHDNETKARWMGFDSTYFLPMGECQEEESADALFAIAKGLPAGKVLKLYLSNGGKPLSIK